MPSRDIPDEFRDRPFPLAEARAAGISRRMLRGTRFRVVTRGVYSTATAPKSYSTFVRATLLTLRRTTALTHRARPTCDCVWYWQTCQHRSAMSSSATTTVRRVDLVYLAFKIIIEYEGDQHRTDRGQWNRDIDRHEDFVRGHWTLIRVTSERLRWPRQVVRSVFEALRSAGYEGPEPTFDQAWSNLFERPDRSLRRPWLP
jgi:hypothetical protein